MKTDPLDVDWKNVDEQLELFIEDVMEMYGIPADYVVKAMLEKAFDLHLEVHGTLDTVALLGFLVQNICQNGPAREMHLMKRMHS